MTREERDTIESCNAIMTLINSPEWAADIHGRLQRTYYELCQTLDLSDGAAEEWLYEEDDV